MSKLLDEFERKNSQLIAENGPWTAHDIYLGENVYTRKQRNRHFPYRLKKIVQASIDLAGVEPGNLRVLDLGCLEGGISVEFARHGCNVIGIEGRPSNLKKAELVKETLSLHTLQLIVDDVLNISADKYGMFDIILCLGLLYHIDAPDMMDFIKKMFNMCKRVIIIDTQVATYQNATGCINVDGKKYFGKSIREHGIITTKEEKRVRSWTSLTNNYSFWLTRASLINLLADAGFTSVYEIQHPFFVSYNNRIMLAAIKGVKYSIHYPEEVNEHVDSSRQPETLRTSEGIWAGKGPAVINTIIRVFKYLYMKLIRRST